MKTGRRRMRRRGRGKAWDWIKRTANKANDWLKQTGAISKVANTLGSVGVPYASAIGKAAGSVGYGRRRYRIARRRRRGRGMRGGAYATPLTANYPYVTAPAIPRGLGMR